MGETGLSNYSNTNYPKLQAYIYIHNFYLKNLPQKKSLVIEAAMKTIFSLLVISFCLLQALRVEAWGEKYHVFIKNGISHPLPLSIHCYSTENDLGFHVLKLEDNFNFRFRMNFWGTTRFWCDFWWNGSHACRIRCLQFFHRR